MAKISMRDLDRMLADVDVPDADIAAFLELLPDKSTPFNPIAVPDPAKVERRTRSRSSMPKRRSPRAS